MVAARGSVVIHQGIEPLDGKIEMRARFPRLNAIQQMKRLGHQLPGLRQYGRQIALTHCRQAAQRAFDTLALMERTASIAARLWLRKTDAAVRNRIRIRAGGCVRSPITGQFPCIASHFGAIGVSAIPIGERYQFAPPVLPNAPGRAAFGVRSACLFLAGARTAPTDTMSQRVLLNLCCASAHLAGRWRSGGAGDVARSGCRTRFRPGSSAVWRRARPHVTRSWCRGCADRR